MKGKKILKERDICNCLLTVLLVCLSYMLCRNSPTVLRSVELSVVQQASKPIILDDEGVQVFMSNDATRN
jgi:hypothetical protein